MKVSTFFKILNRKIEKYDRLATNPFTNPQAITLVWVEDVQTDKEAQDVFNSNYLKNCRYFEAESIQNEKDTN